MTRPYIIPIFIPFLGCPFTCLYCQQEKITGHQSGVPSTFEIRERVEAFLKTRHPHRYSHAEVAFYGGSFTGLSFKVISSLLRAVHPYVVQGKVQSLRASTKPDFVTRDILEEVRSYGMTTMELGVQSLDDEVLRKVGRGYGVREVERAVGLLREEGMKVGIQLMPGLPGASREEALQTTLKTIGLRPDFVRIYPTLVLKDTALARFFCQGQYQPWSLSEATRVCRLIKREFLRAGIPIIKMGLEFSSDEEKEILAGPYHPNFHRLVCSSHDKI